MADAEIFRVALTGSIAMGKSTVAQMFRDAGVPVFDADAYVHEIYAENGMAVEPIRRIFPDVIVDGAVDRQKLSALVLNDTSAIKQLEAIVHPLVRQAQNTFLQFAADQQHSMVLFDIPLLFEGNRETEFDAVLVVSAPADMQRQRALAREGMDEEKFAAILARQMSDEEKRKRATHIISTGVAMKDTKQQVLDIIEQLRGKSEAKNDT